MAGVTTAALVGATGGAGTTRSTVELAALLARDGERVAVLDAAFETQGLAQYVEGRIDPDITRLLVEDATLDGATVPLELACPGTVETVPARAPFQRLARAKAPAAARAFEDLIGDAAARFDRVLVDTPPLAGNQAVGAVNAVERVVPVVPESTRGVDALQRLQDRLADVGVAAGPSLAVRSMAPETDQPDAQADDPDPLTDAVVPRVDGATAADAPSVLDDEAFAAAVASAAETVLDCTVDLTFEQSGLVSGQRLQELVGLRERSG